MWSPEFTLFVNITVVSTHQMDWQTVTTVVELLLKTPAGRLDKFKKKKKLFSF